MVTPLTHKTIVSDTMQHYYDRIPLLRESYLNSASIMGSTVRETPQMVFRGSHARGNTLENEYPTDRPETEEKELV